jgi:hypothetical protein
MPKNMGTGHMKDVFSPNREQWRKQEEITEIIEEQSDNYEYLTIL